jgi:adenylylsulfate kinase
MSRTLWLTGLSGSGKSTLAQALAHTLHTQGRACVVLDGDALRRSLCRDLGFTAADRSEKTRRVAEVARLFNQSGALAIVALVSPMRADRTRARVILGGNRMLEIYLSTPLEVCERRDPKGLYQRARTGEIADFTGISAPYQPPRHAQLVLDTGQLPLPDCTARVLHALDAST